MSKNLTSTPLTTGLVLQFDRDRALDAITDTQVDRARAIFDRSTQIEEMHAIVEHLVADAGAAASRHLERILEALGWGCNRTADIAELAAAAETLARDVVDGPRLARALEVAELEQHKWWGRREELRERPLAFEALCVEATMHDDRGAIGCVLDQFLASASIEQLAGVLEAAAARATPKQLAAMNGAADEQRAIMRESCDGSCGKAAS